jgi:hypothetical protein
MLDIQSRHGLIHGTAPFFAPRWLDSLAVGGIF